MSFPLKVWFSFVFGWFCDWNIMGCDGLWWLGDVGWICRDVVFFKWKEKRDMEIWRKKRVKQIREETDIDKEEREKEKLVKYYRQSYSNRVYLHGYVAFLYIYKGLEWLMLVFFVPYCVNFFTFCILQWLMQLLMFLLFVYFR